jgi:hypothetical protein
MVLAESGFELLDDCSDEEYSRIWDHCTFGNFNKEIPTGFRKKIDYS